MVRAHLPQSELPRKGSRVAVIGLGMAGATAAKLLATQHSVVGIEALPGPGLCYYSIADGTMSFDVPLRAVSPHYYPNLFAWYTSIGVDLVPVNYQSTGSDAATNEPYFKYSNALFLGMALSWPELKRGAILQTIRIVVNYLWLVFASIYWLRFHSEQLKRMTIGQYLREHRYSADFIDRFFLPVMSTLLSCSYEQVLSYPADLLLTFYCQGRTTFFTGWRRLRCGVRVVADTLLEGIECRYNSRVDKVTRAADGTSVLVHFKGQREPERFDYVVIATDAPVAKMLLADASPDEATLLGAVGNFGARIVAHTDDSLMPVDATTWSGLNYFSSKQHPQAFRTDSPLRPSKPHDASMTTACMQKFGMTRCDELLAAPGGSGGAVPQHVADHDAHVYQTWNPYREPKKETIIREAYMHRAVWDVAGRQRFDEACARGVQGSRRVWFAGSYCSTGITLLEQACTSGLDVGLDFGASLPFEVKHQPEYMIILVAFSVLLRVLDATIGKVWRFLLLTILAHRPRFGASNTE